jgi:hypothetical protein
MCLASIGTTMNKTDISFRLGLIALKKALKSKGACCFMSCALFVVVCLSVFCFEYCSQVCTHSSFGDDGSSEDHITTCCFTIFQPFILLL